MVLWRLSPSRSRSGALPRQALGRWSALLVGLALAAGCSSLTNLDERPEWAKAAGAEIPPSHPRYAEFPSTRYMTIVAEGTGPTIESARAAAEKAAQHAFSRQIISRVSSRYESDRRSASYEGSSGASSESAEELVRQSIKVASDQFLSSLRALSIWDEGFVRDEKTDAVTRYVYGAYVIDKEVAADQALSIAQRTVRDLEVLTSGPLHEQAALDGLKKLLDFEIVSVAVTFFGRTAPSFPGVPDLRRKCQNFLLQAGEARVQSGDERRIEEALSLYETCNQYDPGGVWPGRIVACKRLLPCLNCGRSGRCTACQGERGRKVACPVCYGSTRVLETCGACEGTGEGKCRQCNGTRTVAQRCSNPNCRNGQEPCPKCGGSGRIAARCNACKGTGQHGGWPCQQCGGTGTVIQPCPPSLPFLEALGGCGGTGWKTCSRCGGTMQEQVRCPTCSGTGRQGPCPRCGGTGRIEIKCRSCTDGTRWEACTTCGGTVVCPVCKGQRHRM